MQKKPTKKWSELVYGVLFLAGIYFFWGVVFSGGVIDKTGLVLGLNENNGKGFSFGNNDDDNNSDVSPTEVPVMATETPLPTYQVTETPVITPLPTEEIIVLPTEEAASIQEDSGSQVDEPEVIYKTEKVVIYVPVSERSTVSTGNTIIPTAKKSVLKVIRNKISQVGRGEILTKPKQAVTPTVVERRKPEDVDDDVLDAEADIFYRLQGEKVLLGAQNKEGSNLKIKEEDLRSAEVTLNKVLMKKDLSINLTSDSQFALVNGVVTTVFDMPIYVNIDSHKVYLETEEGKKELKILPEQAVREAVDLKSFEKLNKDSVPSVEDLGEELAYRVVGDKTYNLFGLFKVVTRQNVYITAETGEVIEGNQPLMTKVVRLFSL